MYGILLSAVGSYKYHGGLTPASENRAISVSAIRVSGRDKSPNLWAERCSTKVLWISLLLICLLVAGIWLVARLPLDDEMRGD